MSKITPEQEKINTAIARKLDISIKEVEKAIDLYHKGVSIKIKLDVPCTIILPYLGKLVPGKTYLKEFNEKQNEVNNSGGGVPSIQS